MNYLSTRGGMPAIGFREAVITGLAPDGGLILPESIPNVEAKLEGWSKLAYSDLAFEVIRLYTDIPDAVLRELIDASYSAFDHPEIAPIVSVGDLYIQELFHGPTLAFKDIALQLLGNLFSLILAERDARLNILAATSGDTGSAAIAGVRGRDKINIFVMHPEGRVAPLQERQMTTVLDENVFNLAIAGSFDDCQEIMKSIFCDNEFKNHWSLGSVNSVNWARVLAQTVYYFYAYFRVAEQSGAERVQFAVPTGNFGDILAGFYAYRMGLPIERLILATNENNILARFFNTGVYQRGTVAATISPAMDIQVASNFERYLYYLLGEDAGRIATIMREFSANGHISIEGGKPIADFELFAAGAANTTETLAAIKEMHDQFGYIPDPHTAVGIHVARQLRNPQFPTICLATAHPAKFSQAIEDTIGEDVHHPTLDRLADLPTRQQRLPSEESSVRDYIQQTLAR